MGIKVKSAAEAAKKWGEVTPGRSGYYQAGAAAAGADWEANTIAAQKSFVAGVTAGNIGQMFAGGVKKAGSAKFTRKVTEVGGQRFGQGVSAAIQDYQSGAEPMLATIASLTLPPRAPRGSSSNLERVRVIADALNKKRLALRSAGA